MAALRGSAAAMAGAAAIARASGRAPVTAATAAAEIVPPPRVAAAATVAASTPIARRQLQQRAMQHVVRMLTFNIWFDPRGMRARMRALGQIVEKCRPAVIGFQEVTRESLAMLKAQRWTRFYDCSVDTARPFSEAYFVVLFSALPVRALETLPFANTGMGRELVAMEVEVAPGHSLFVATAHLESMPQSRQTRVAQLQESLQVLSERVAGREGAGSARCLGAIFMGDTNLLRGDMKLLGPTCAVPDIKVEEAKTARSRCRKCNETIAKGAVRVGKTAKDVVPGGRVLEMTMWFHHDCFVSDGATKEEDKEAVYASGLYQSSRSSDTAGGNSERGTATRSSSTNESGELRDRAAMGLPPLWKDLWLTVDGNTEENGYTYDGKRNTMISNRSYQSRFDRVYLYPGAALCNGDPPTWTASAVLDKIELVGTEPFTDGLWPSDHFGVLTTLCLDAFVHDSSNELTSPDEPERIKRSRSAGSQARPIEIE